LHLIFPFGLLVIAIRFLLRAALVAMGRADLDVDPHGLGKPKPSDAEPEPEASG
jgi:hypothetical protein